MPCTCDSQPGFALLTGDRSRESCPELGACPEDSLFFPVLPAKEKKWKSIFFFLLDDLNVVIEAVKFQIQLLAKGKRSAQNSLGFCRVPTFEAG